MSPPTNSSPRDSENNTGADQISTTTAYIALIASKKIAIDKVLGRVDESIKVITVVAVCQFLLVSVLGQQPKL